MNMVLLAYVGLLCFGFLDNFRAPEFSEILNDLSLSHSQGALFYAVTSAMSFSVGIWVPKLLHFVSTVWLVRMGLALMGILFIALSYCQSLGQLIGAAVGFGVGIGIVNVAQNLLVTQGAPWRRHRQLLAGLHSMYALSALLAPAAAWVLHRYGWTWRQGFQVVGVFPIVVALLPWTAQKISESSPIDEQERSSSKPQRQTGGWFAVGMLALYVVAEVALSSRMALYFERELGWTLSESRTGLCAFFVFLFLGRLLFTLRPGRHTDFVLVTSSGLSLIAFLLGLFVSPLFLIACGLTMAPFFPLTLEWIGHHFEVHFSEKVIARAVSYGSLAVVTMHMGIGVIADAHSIQVGLLIGPVALFFAFICALRSLTINRLPS